MPQPAPTYEAAIENLSALIPELFSTPTTSPDQPRRKFSLDQIRILSAALGNPHRQFPAVLIAGTNGKGSTASTLASIAHASNLRTGLYTSPHLERVNERIKLFTPNQKIDQGTPGPGSLRTDLRLGGGDLDLQTWDQNSGHPQDPHDIPDPDFARLYFEVHDTAQQLVLDRQLPTLPSYFELLTALAFLYFAEQKVDLAILEVGMGGRLDATNLVDPILSVITDISLDHQEWLGETIAEITREKAGILRPNSTLVTLPQHPEANQAIGEIAVPLNVRAVSAADYMPAAFESHSATYPIDVLGQTIQVDSPLKGPHQHRNIALAIAAAVELSDSSLSTNFPTITPISIQRGIHNTYWPGRLEFIQLGHQQFILDVAHNPAGAWALRSALSSLNTPPDAPAFAQWPSSVLGAPGLASETGDPQAKCLIFACLRDKPLREMTQILFPIFDHVILAPIHSPRATEGAGLLAAAQATGVPSTPASTVAEAIDLALKLSVPRIVISGSLYLVGEARTLLLARVAAQTTATQP